MDNPAVNKCADNSNAESSDKIKVDNTSAKTSELCSNKKEGQLPDMIENKTDSKECSVILNIPDIMSHLENNDGDTLSNLELNSDKTPQQNVDILQQTNTQIESSNQEQADPKTETKDTVTIKTSLFQDATDSISIKLPPENGSNSSEMGTSPSTKRSQNPPLQSKDIQERVSRASNVKLDVYGNPIFRPKSPSSGRPTPAGKMLIRKCTPAQLPKFAKLNAKDRFAGDGMLEETEEDVAANADTPVKEKDKLPLATGGLS